MPLAELNTGNLLTTSPPLTPVLAWVRSLAMRALYAILLALVLGVRSTPLLLRISDLGW